MKAIAVGRLDLARRLNFVSAIGPSLFLCAFLVTGAYVRLHLGRWPNSSDHITTPLMKSLDLATFCACYWTVYAFPMWLLTSAWLLLQRRFRLTATRAALYIGVIALTIACLRLDPTSFTDFFFD